MSIFVSCAHWSAQTPPSDTERAELISLRAEIARHKSEEAELARLRAECAAMKEEHEELVRLRAENASLKEKVAQLQGHVRTLETKLAVYAP